MAASYAPFLKKLKEDHPDTVFAVQLNHGGRSAVTVEGKIGPSDVKLRNVYRNFDLTDCHEMTVEDIDAMVLEYVRAAVRAKSVGFDCVMIHGAHGYLLEQFLSPLYNKRTDEYGGPIENRARFLLRVVTRVREVLGEDFPVAVKLNTSDFAEGGLTVEDSTKVAVMLAEAGVSFIEASGGC